MRLPERTCRPCRPLARSLRPDQSAPAVNPAALAEARAWLTAEPDELAALEAAAAPPATEGEG